MATKKDLVKHVDYLNDKYCKNTKNHFVISQSYGGIRRNFLVRIGNHINKVGDSL